MLANHIRFPITERYCGSLARMDVVLRVLGLEGASSPEKSAPPKVYSTKLRAVEEPLEKLA